MSPRTRLAQPHAAVWAGAILWFTLGLWLSAAAEIERGASFAAALESITAGELRAEVDWMADDAREGREAGTPGAFATARRIAAHFKTLGLQPGVNGESYFQPFGPGYRNVIGVLPGADPILGTECVIISAHYDHVGRGAKGSRGTVGEVHNGADDNASGVAALLEVAEAFSLLPSRPRRTLLFIGWDAEEKGILGSKHWVSEPTVPITRVVAMLNADMIGQVRDNRLLVYGSRTAPGLRERISRANDVAALDLDLNWDHIPNSDQWPFAQNGRPVVLLHAGLTDQYHTEHDDPDTLCYDGIHRTARLLFSLAWSLAEEDPLGPFREASLKENEVKRRTLERQRQQPPTRLGVQWETRPRVPDEAGIRVAQVHPDSSAARADIRRGDRLLTIDGRPISLNQPDAFQLAVMMAEHEIEIELLRAEHDQPMRRVVSLAETAAPLGMRLFNDDAEPGVLVVGYVAAGSPAASAGLQPGDRIYTVHGRPCTSHEQLLTHDHSGVLELEVERDGRIRRLQITTGHRAT